MTNFQDWTFNSTIPAANNNPSDDQPEMLNNNISTAGIIATDHISFGQNNGGTHIQNTYIGYASPTLPASTPEASVAYPAAGEAVTANAQYYYENAVATFPISAIKAFAVFNTLTTSGTITPINQFNVTSIVEAVSGVAESITLTFASNIVSTTLQAAVFISLNSGILFTNPAYTYTPGVTATLVIRITPPAGIATMSVTILQI